MARSKSTTPSAGAISKRSIVIEGHRTSVAMEDAFWHALKEIAAERGLSLSAVIAEIDAERADGNLSSAIRVYVLESLQKAATKR